jgi:hypothetical protein
MPLDPAIALGVNPPAPIKSYQTSLAQIGQQQDQAQARQVRGMEIQQARQGVTDQETYRKALQASGGDLDRAANLIEQQMGDPKGAAALRAHAAEARTQLIKNGKEQIETQSKALAMASQIAQTITDEPSFQLGRKATAALLGPDMAAHLGDAYDPERIKQAVGMGETAKERLDRLKQAADSAEAAVKASATGAKDAPATLEHWMKAGSGMLSVAQTPEAWSTAQKNLKALGMPPEALASFGAFDQTAPQRAAQLGMAPKERADVSTAAINAQTARGNLGVSQQRETREGQQFNATFGGGMTPDGKPAEGSALAKAIANYQVPPPATRSMASGLGQALMNQVLRENPDYKAEMFPTRAATRKAFTSGTQSQTINSLNTAIVHLDQFVDVAKALDNGTFKPGNAAYNWVKTQFGDSAPTNFKGISTIMAGELASAFKKSGATDEEIAAVRSAIETSNSPKQLKDYATTIAIPALGGKAATFDEQYRQVMGEKDPFQVILPGAKQVLEKYGFDPKHPRMGQATSGSTTAGPKPNTPGGVMRARDQLRKLHEAPAGTALPAGWKIE